MPDKMTEHELRAKFAKKKNDIVDAVVGVVKTGKASKAQGEYKYAEEAETVKVVRKALTEHGLSFRAAMKGFAADPVARQVGKFGVWYYIYSIIFEMTLTDCETGYYETCQWIGLGDDPSDKAIRKAATGAVKYFLLKNFLIPTRDDSEALEQPGGTPQQNGPEKPKQDYPEPGEPFKKRETQQTAKQDPAPANQQHNMPSYEHKNTPELMAALGDHFRGQDTGNYKFNEAKFKAEVWQRFGQWPTTATGAKKIRSEIMHLDVSDEK